MGCDPKISVQDVSGCPENDAGDVSDSIGSFRLEQFYYGMKSRKGFLLHMAPKEATIESILDRQDTKDEAVPKSAGQDGYLENERASVGLIGSWCSS